MALAPDPGCGYLWRDPDRSPERMLHLLRNAEVYSPEPLERVLPALTSNVARLLLLPLKGHIAIGTDADLVVLDADGPANDLMARGRWHTRSGRSVRRGTFGRGERA